MTALKPAQIDAFLARPNPAQPVVLVYGPDAGLVNERAAALVRSFVDDMNDPFSLARLEGDDLASEPTRLVEEANTIPLFGGRRAVWVKGGARNFAAAVEALVANASPDCRVVIEAGDLRKNAPLRVICEKATNAVALPCYEDDEQALGRLVDAEMRDAGLAIAPEARAMLIPLLGGDRLASRSEIGKLALYARGKQRVELDDVMAVVSDASALAIDELIEARPPTSNSSTPRHATPAPRRARSCSRLRAMSAHCTRRGSRSRVVSRPRAPSAGCGCTSAGKPLPKRRCAPGPRRGSNAR
jgi:DNA polymerase-3 subunit delta